MPKYERSIQKSDALELPWEPPFRPKGMGGCLNRSKRASQGLYRKKRPRTTDLYPDTRTHIPAIRQNNLTLPAPAIPRILALNYHNYSEWLPNTTARQPATEPTKPGIFLLITAKAYISPWITVIGVALAVIGTLACVFAMVACVETARTKPHHTLTDKSRIPARGLESSARMIHRHSHSSRRP